jgi:hypothetical protein
MSKLKIGDKVMWSGGFGTQAHREAKVVSIEDAPDGGKYGYSVQEMDWSDVPGRAVVDLDNGHWAYGIQLRPWSTA